MCLLVLLLIDSVQQLHCRTVSLLTVWGTTLLVDWRGLVRAEAKLMHNYMIGLVTFLQTFLWRQSASSKTFVLLTEVSYFSGKLLDGSALIGQGAMKVFGLQLKLPEHVNMKFRNAACIFIS